MSASEFTDVFEIPTNGGRREGAGRKKGYSPKTADDLFSGIDDGTASDTTRVAASFAKARARKEGALADLNELSFKVKSGEYVSRAAVQEAAATLLSSLAQSLRSLPDNLERKFDLAPAVAAQVELVIDSALADVASGLEMFSSDAPT